MYGQTTKSALIGIDIGTSSVKAVMAGLDGALLDTYSGSHRTSRPSPGASEQDPDDWMAHVDAALRQFSGHPLAEKVEAVGITSQVNTHVFCDELFRALCPALTWQDIRPADHAAQIETSIDPKIKEIALGAPIPIDASHALARMAWMADNHPDLWTRTEHVFLPKDYAIACLTGVASADPISAVGLVGVDMTYAPDIVSQIPGAQALLPPLSDPLSFVGQMSPDQPFAGIPVVSGTMDAWASMFGLGVAEEGAAMYLTGTSDVLGLISSNRHGAPGIITFPDWRGITLHAGPTQAGGASLAWLSQVLGQDIETLGRLAIQAPIRRDSPLFLPHLEGERAPLWDPISKGVFAGMTSATGPAELVAAVMEGVAFSARMAIEAIEVSGGQKISSLRHGGGGAVSDVWCQIRANALNRQLDRVSAAQPGAMGALVIAGAATGHMRDLTEATRSLVSVETSFRPDPGAAQIADVRFGAFQDLYAALGPIHRCLKT